MNHVNLVGQMTNVPTFFQLPNGRRTAHFTLITSEMVLDQDGNSKETKQWHRVFAWGKWVRVLEQLGAKGLQIAVEGKLTSRFYFKGGKREFVAAVEVNDLIIL